MSYPVNISMILLIVVAGYGLLTIKLSTARFVLVGLLISTLALSMVQNQEGISALLSLIPILAVSPIIMRARYQLEKEEVVKICKSIRVSVYIIFALQLLDILVWITVGEYVQNFIPTPLGKELYGYIYHEAKRFYGLFDEPAHMSIMLVFSYYLHVKIDQSSVGIKVVGIVWASLIMSGSLLGIVLGLAVTARLALVKYRYSNKRLHVRAFMRTSVGTIVFIVIMLAFTEGYTQKIVSKIARTAEVLSTGEIRREGLRVNAVRLIWDEYGEINAFGPGYHETSDVLSSAFYVESNKVSNLLVFLIFQTGIIVTCIFICTMAVGVRLYSTYDWLMFVLIMFSTGAFVSILFWYPIFCIAFDKTVKK